MKHRAVLVALAFAVAIAASGCSSSGSPHATTNTKSRSTSKTKKTTTTAPTPGQAVLESVSLAKSDVAAGDRIRLWPEGDDVQGQVTHDLCGADFPSEALRVERHQVGAAAPNGDQAGVSTEAVLYDTPDDAQQALQEVRDAHDHCPAGPAHSNVADVPNMTYAFAPAPDVNWPQTDGVTRYALDFAATDPKGTSYHELEIEQVRGRLLVILYVEPDRATKALAPSVGDVEHLTGLIAQRMAAVPDSAVLSTT